MFNRELFERILRTEEAVREFKAAKQTYTKTVAAAAELGIAFVSADLISDTGKELDE